MRRAAYYLGLAAVMTEVRREYMLVNTLASPRHVITAFRLETTNLNLARGPPNNCMWNYLAHKTSKMHTVA
ncbi:hypothetical protein OPQ81_008329 [Rhizoctonia solani]|nr:hypothetical protein OPQ81_008329 [Rhizoctonia solani]